MSPTVNPETPVPGARHRLERAGIGVVEVTELCPPATEWEELEHLLTVAIAQLLWNDFLVIEYDHTPATSDTPAAWVRPSEDAAHGYGRGHDRPEHEGAGAEVLPQGTPDEDEPDDERQLGDEGDVLAAHAPAPGPRTASM